MEKQKNGTKQLLLAIVVAWERLLFSIFWPFKAISCIARQTSVTLNQMSPRFTNQQTLDIVVTVFVPVIILNVILSIVAAVVTLAVIHQRITKSIIVLGGMLGIVLVASTLAYGFKFFTVFIGVGLPHYMLCIPFLPVISLATTDRKWSTRVELLYWTSFVLLNFGWIIIDTWGLN